MTVENFTTYTESDASNRFTVTSTRATFANWVAEDGATYLYIDKGAAYYNGSFSFNFTFTLTTGTVDLHQCIIWGVSEGIGNRLTWYNSGNKSLCMRAYGDTSEKVQLVQVRGVASDAYSGAITISLNTIYYATVFKDESVGTYGTLYLYLYSDSARTALVGNVSLTLLTSLADYQYLYALNTWPIGAYLQNGYIENLEDTALPSPTVTTQSVTAISGTTATGNGNVTNLGIPFATQHGHCWSTSVTPTTANSKTENGVPSATGAYTSSITGLTAGTKYYVRAYVINSQGTAYGNEVFFWANKGDVYPYDTVQRVARISRNFWSGPQGMGVWQAEVGIGGISGIFVPPLENRNVDSSLPTGKVELSSYIKQTTEQAKMNIQRSLNKEWNITPEQVVSNIPTQSDSGALNTAGLMVLWKEWEKETEQMLAGGAITKVDTTFTGHGRDWKPNYNQMNPRQRYLIIEADKLLAAGRISQQEWYDRTGAIVNPRS